MMRRTGRWVFLATFLLAGCGGGGKAEWKEVHSKEGGFTVTMPSAAKQDKLEQDKTPVGPITLVVHSAEGGKDTYRAEYADLPPKVPFDDIKEFVQPIATRYEGKVTKEEGIEVAGHKGWAFEMDAQKPKGHVAGRVFIVKNRLYQLLVVGPDVSGSSADVKKFFDSFKLDDPLMK
jgi:hypothetical protein